jgi:hypothetical protein
VSFLASTWQDRGGSFQRPQDEFLHSLSNAPVALNKGCEQAEKTSVATESLLRGCPITNFEATLPFNRMKKFFADLKKRPHGPALKRPKGYKNCRISIKPLALNIYKSYYHPLKPIVLDDWKYL